MLKNTGLGYTVIRAGPLLEEPGGYKALIFDQVSALPRQSVARCLYWSTVAHQLEHCSCPVSDRWYCLNHVALE